MCNISLSLLLDQISPIFHAKKLMIRLSKKSPIISPIFHAQKIKIRYTKNVSILI